MEKIIEGIDLPLKTGVVEFIMILIAAGK